MVMARWQASIVDSQGNTLNAASVEVRNEADNSLATLYSDRAGSVPLGNPFSADSDGYAFFHAAAGTFKITATKSGVSKVWRYVMLGLSQASDTSVGGPGPGTVAGQLAVFADTNGNLLDGAEISANSVLITEIAQLTDLVPAATTTEVRASDGTDYIPAEALANASAAVSLTDAATVSVDWDAGIYFTLTLTANRILGNPTNGNPGQCRYVLVNGNSSTDRTLTFGNQYDGTLPTITDADNAKSYLLTIFCMTSTTFCVTSMVAVS